MRIFSTFRILGLWLTLTQFTATITAARNCAGETSVYQWEVPVPPRANNSATAPADATPHAYLWIPSACHRVRAVVIGQHNMLEEPIFEDPVFRATLAELDFALIWITPSADAVFRFDKDANERFNQMLRILADKSGYTELAYVPVVPIGHSAHASYPWNYAAANPARTLAILSLKGDAPLTQLTGSGRPNPDWGTRTIDGIPGLMVMGQFEWWHDRVAPAEAFRARHPASPIALLCDVGHGHFDTSPPLIAHLTLFLRKAAHYRLPRDFETLPLNHAIPLSPIDPRTGWLVEQWQPGTHGSAAVRHTSSAPYESYTGDRTTAFWAFDEEHARALETYHDQHHRRPQLLGFLDFTGNPIPQTQSHSQVSLAFLPDSDGITFHLKPCFLETVPSGNPEKWSGLPANANITHAIGGGPIKITRICGPHLQLSPDTFMINFSRGTEAHATRNTQDLWFIAAHDGDATHASARQQALMRVPTRNHDGAPQHITFPPIPDQPATTSQIPLTATSDSGLPVRYYVRNGPAYIADDGHTLIFTALPPRTQYPIETTVVAWQYGRATKPQIQTAQPVECRFRLYAK